MRTLFLWVYLLIVGGFVGAVYLMEYLGGDLYERDFSDGYRHYVARISPLIAADLAESTNPQETLAQWQLVVGEELQSLEVITLPTDLNFDSEPVKVTYLETNELADEIQLLVRLDSLSNPTKGLKFYFIDAASESFEAWYQKGLAGVYLFMAFLIGGLILFLSSYLQKIKSLTRSVSQGNLTARMSHNSIPVFRSLADDLNQMVQELESKHQESDIFLGAIHHELRSPITKLRLALDMALHSNNETLLKELIVDMDEDLEELNDLMEDILMLSRLRLQKQMPAYSLFNATELLNKILDDISDPRISLNCTDMTVSNITINSNKMLLERALVNIISNAIKFAKSRVLVEVSEKAGEISIAVSDDGPGIPKEQRSLIFQPFYRVDKARARNTGGVGLGLAIANLVIHKLAGKISIEDSALGGAKFVLQLPKTLTETDSVTLADNSHTKGDKSRN